MNGLLEARPLLEGGPRGLTHALERTLWHLGFSDVRMVDGRDDGGADILAVRNSEQWVIQAKWSGRGPIDRAGVDDCERAKALYGADRVRARHQHEPQPHSRAAPRRPRARGHPHRCLGRRDARRHRGPHARTVPSGQNRGTTSAPPSRRSSGTSTLTAERLLVLATGLGKTVIGGEVIARPPRAQPRATRSWSSPT